MKQKQTDPLKVVLSKHRVSYVHIKEASSFEGDGKKFYDCTFLIPKDHPDVQKIEAAIKSAYTANKESVFKGTPLTSPKIWNPLRDGDEWLEDHPEATEYADCYFIKAKTESRPPVYDENKDDIIDLDEVYSGCYCRGVIKGSVFNKNGNRGFSFWLNSLMKMEDGDRLGGFDASADEYDDSEDLT